MAQRSQGVVLVICLLAAGGAQAQICTPVPPSHGDLEVLPSGRVLIYTGPDGTDVPNLWSTINGGETHGDVPKTLCQQLGFNDGSMTTRIGDENEIASRYVWLSNISCPSEFQTRHILRCRSSVLSMDSSAARNHSNDIHLKCTPSLRIPAQNDANTYIGQSTLLPPTSALGCNRSRSYGAPLIKHYTWRWDYIKNDDTILSRNDTDTICRDMGYTHSVRNYMLTVGQSKLIFGGNSNYNFSPYGHIDSSKFNCIGSCPCVGCCKNLTNVSSAVDRLDELVELDDDAILIRCSFYSPVSSSLLTSDGHRDVCEVYGRNGTIRRPQLCPTIAASNSDEVTFTKQNFTAIIATPISVLLLVIIGMCFACVVHWWWGRRGRGQGYNQVDGGGAGGGGGVRE